MCLFVFVLMIGMLNVQSATVNCTSPFNKTTTIQSGYVNVSCSENETLVSCGFEVPTTAPTAFSVGGTRILSNGGEFKCQARIAGTTDTDLTAYAYCCDFASAGYSMECAVITAFGTSGNNEIQSANCSSPTSSPTASPTALLPTASPIISSAPTASPTNSQQPTPSAVLVDCSPHLTATTETGGTTGSWMSNINGFGGPPAVSNFPDTPTDYTQCNAKGLVDAEAYCCQDTSKPLSCLTGYFLLSADGGSTLSKKCSDVTNSTDYTMMSCNVVADDVGIIAASYVDTDATCQVKRFDVKSSEPIFAMVTCCTLATASPTTSPSLAPTGNPTEATSAPSTSPSASPTQSPSADPTTEPTKDPTADPTTKDPTADPTKDPTKDPTTDPTKGPTGDPTTDPTRDPTQDPTADPTEDPTADPTKDPTGDPTTDPTHGPTLEPTRHPTKEPTVEPTIDPTVSPSKSPSQSPTKSPTSEPTPAPTTDPTSAPSLAPTSAPSRAPSFNPTPRPTPRPTRRPTKRPVVAYTPAPHTKRPTRSPTSAPTVFVPGELDLTTMFVLPMIATLALSVFLFAVACLQKWLRKREKEKFRLMYDTRARAEEQRKERERLTQPAEESVTTQQMNKWVRKMDAKAARERKKEMERERDVEAGIELQSAPTQPRWTAAADDEEEEKVPLR